MRPQSKRNYFSWLAILWTLVTLGLIAAFLVFDNFDRQVVLSTVGLGLAASLISVSLGGLLAWVCCGNRRLNRFMLISTLALITIPIFVQVSAWDAAFGRLGWLTSREGQVLVPLVSGWRAAAWVHGLAAAPQVAIILLVGLIWGRQQAEEQALLETNRLRVFWYITLPRIYPLVLLSVLWTMITCAREITATDLYQVGTLAEQVYLGYSLGQFNALAGNWTAEDLQAAAQLNLGLAILLIAWFVATAMILVLRLFHHESEPGDNVHFLLSQSDVLENDFIRKLKLFTSCVIWGILVIVPLTNLLVRGSFFVKSVQGVPSPQYSIERLAEVLFRASRDYTLEFFWSFTIAITASLLIMVLAMSLVWKARGSIFWKSVLILAFSISCAIPGPMMGTILIKGFNLFDFPLFHWLYDRTIFAPVLATAWFCFPLPPLIAWYIYRDISPEVIENAKLEGISPIRIFFRFALLDYWPQWLAVWLLTFCLCFGELSAAYLVVPPGIDTLPRLMLGMLHAGVDEMTAALTLVLIGIMVVVTVVAWNIFRLISGVNHEQ